MQVDYRQPYVRGTSDKFKTALEGTAFNNRKTSGVFNSGKRLILALPICDAILCSRARLWLSIRLDQEHHTQLLAVTIAESACGCRPQVDHSVTDHMQTWVRINRNDLAQ